MIQTAPIITIFGGSGFLGKYITQRLAKAGCRIRVAVRKPNEALFVKPYGSVGQVEPIQANVRDEASIRNAIKDADVVINCTGVTYPNSHQSFDDLYNKAATLIARIAKEEHINKLIHVSALGADNDSECKFMKTKAEGEATLLQEFPSAIIIRPAVMFGDEDRFLNNIATCTKFGPVLPIVGANTKLQPVYVDDVANAVEKIALENHTHSTYNLAGPEIKTMKQIAEQVLKITHRRRFILNLPFWMGFIDAAMLDMIHFLSLGIIKNKLITRDQVRALKSDMVLGDASNGFEILDISPSSMNGIVEEYLYYYRPYGQYYAITASGKNLR